MRRHLFSKAKVMHLLVLALVLAGLLLVPAQMALGADGLAPTVTGIDPPAGSIWPAAAGGATFFSANVVSVDPLVSAELQIRNGAGQFWTGGVGFTGAATWVPIEFKPRALPQWLILLETFRINVAGNYTVTFRATDDEGLTGTSAPVAFSVGDVVAPVVNVTNPVDGSVQAVVNMISGTIVDASAATTADLEMFMSVRRASDGRFFDEATGTWTVFENLIFEAAPPDPGGIVKGGVSPNFTFTWNSSLITLADVYTVSVWVFNLAEGFGTDVSTYTIGVPGPDVLAPNGVITVAPTTITNAGVGNFQVTIDYNEPMRNVPAPTVAFAPNVVAGGTLILNAGLSLWTSATQFRAVYDSVDLNENIVGVGVTVTGAMDVAGNVQNPSNLAPAFNVNTTAAALLPSILRSQRGLFVNRTIANLAANDGANVTIRSLAMMGTSSTDWYGSFRLGAGAAPTRLEVNYDGSQSIGVFQVLSVYNFRTRLWETKDERMVVAGTDYALNWAMNAPADYVFGFTKEVRVRISAYTVQAPFVTSADQLILLVTR